ncbi:hypothetical protein FO519_007892 [Halicephalobus sp. NKZ332]|nr:hypothetical protein FO519_007892 [Halicephalobus sp. NKZ332]
MNADSRYNSQPHNRMMNYRSRGNAHADVRQRTRRHDLVSIDPDIQARADIVDDDNDVPARGKSEVQNVKMHTYLKQSKQLHDASSGTRNMFATQVTVKHCASSGLHHILKTISYYVDNFRPIAPQIRDNDIEFYVMDSAEAAAIVAMNKRIVDKKNRGNRLTIYSRRSNAPWSNLDRRLRDVITNVVRKRYNAATNTLDLSDFGGDSDFTSKKMLCGLSRNDIMVTVCDIVEKEFGNITGLSLKDNRLRSLIYPSTLCFRAKKIKILDLSNNDLMKLDVLDRISFWEVEKLHVENNPLCTNYTTADEYTRDVHKYLPYVSYLDGVNVEPKAIPGVKEDKRSHLLPKMRLGYSDNDSVKAMVENFLNEYFILYDDPDPVNKRKLLINAYYENAEFSYAVNTVETQPYAKGDAGVYSAYLRGSRNILLEDKWRNFPERVGHNGAMAIAVQLSKMPATQHQKETFLLDIDFFHGNMCGFTLRGLFRDLPCNDERQFKFFMRNMVVLSTGSGTMAIVLDTWHIIPVTKNLADSYRQNLTTAALVSVELPGTSGLHQPPRENITGAVPSIVVTAPPPTPQPIDANMRRQMIERFSAQTGMTLPFAERCLEDNNFDYEEAGRRFNEIRSQIPPEAFRTTS